MKKFDSKSPETKSGGIVSASIDVLKVMFPDAFTEGGVDFDVLKKLIYRATDERTEKYRLNWHVKLCMALDGHAQLTKEIDVPCARARRKRQLRRVAMNMEMQKCDLNSWRVWGGYNG